MPAVALAPPELFCNLRSAVQHASHCPPTVRVSSEFIAQIIQRKWVDWLRIVAWFSFSSLLLVKEQNLVSVLFSVTSTETAVHRCLFLAGPAPMCWPMISIERKGMIIGNDDESQIIPRIRQ